jgi:hypothetical protein
VLAALCWLPCAGCPVLAGQAAGAAAGRTDNVGPFI